MNNYVTREMIIFLLNVVGLDESSIELAIKLSLRNNTPLPILLWSYGMLTIEELDKLSIKKFLSEFNLSIAFSVLEVQIT